jgi:hypothetical protein
VVDPVGSEVSRECGVVADAVGSEVSRECGVVADAVGSEVSLEFEVADPVGSEVSWGCEVVADSVGSEVSRECEGVAEWTPFQTHCYSENVVEPGIESRTSESVTRNPNTEYACRTVISPDLY